jgi:CheY-like chemotaxis protein
MKFTEADKTKPLHIILADDDHDDRHFFKEALKELPVAHRLTIVGNGQELTDYLVKRHEKIPDLIFIDLNMPRKTGSECLVEIKSDKRLRNIPVVIYSTSLHEDVADLIYQNGAHYYLQKCTFQELTKNLKTILELLAKDNCQPPRNKFTLACTHAKSYNTKNSRDRREKLIP